MKIGIIILNAMFLLMFISTVIGEWGKPAALIAGLSITSVAANLAFIILKTKGDLEE